MKEGSGKGELNVICLAFFLTKYNNCDKINFDLKRNLKYFSVHLQDIVSHVNTITDLNKLCGDGSVKCSCK